jgi:hypothetical protein
MYNAFQSLQALEAGQGQRKAREQETAMKGIGNAFAQGDYTGAANQAFGMGDLSTGMDISKYGKGLEDAAAEEKRVGLIKYGMGLLNTPAQQREAMRPQIAASLQQMGIELDPAQLQTMDLSDEGIKATLSTLQDTDSLMAQYQGMMAPAEYGAPVEALGPDGKPAYVQWSKTGDPRQMEGYTPIQEQGEQWEPIDAPQGMGGYWERSSTTGQTRRVAGPDPVAGGGSGSYGLNVIYGRLADGTRVPLQANSAGGVDLANLPDGVTLEDDRTKSFDRALGTAEGKKAAYQTQQGLAVTAAEEAFNRISAQIDNAISTSDGNNTGLIMGNAPAPNLEGYLETIGANTAFDTLVALKNEGGTLGAISQSELDLLKAKVASLKRTQDERTLDANLELLRAAMQSSMLRIKQAYEAEYANGTYGQATPAPAAPKNPTIGSTIDGLVAHYLKPK